MKHNSLFLFLSIVFCVCLVCSNMFVTRIWSLGEIQLSAAVLLFPVTYIINDLLTEVYGYRATRFILWVGFALCLFISVFSVVTTLLPMPSDLDSQELATKYNDLYGFLPRAMAGSLLAFIAGSLANSMVMSRMKVASRGRHFGVRAIVSSIVGETADSLVFYPIVYIGVLSVKGMFAVMIAEYLGKILYEIIVLPLTAFIVRKVKAYDKMDTIDDGISYNPFKIRDM